MLYNSSAELYSPYEVLYSPGALLYSPGSPFYNTDAAFYSPGTELRNIKLLKLMDMVLNVQLTEKKRKSSKTANFPQNRPFLGHFGGFS